MKGWWFFLVLVVPSVSAWNWDTHQALVESLYVSVDETTRGLLDLDELRRGAIEPDKVFRDFRRHGYPYTVERASYWIEQTKIALEQDDWKNASYAFGVTSHYLSDSFSAPHGVSGEKYYDHKEYEDDASREYLYVPCAAGGYDLAQDLERASHEGDTWEVWMSTRDIAYPQESVALAMELVYVVGLDVFHATCHHKETEVVYLPWYRSVMLRFSWTDMLAVGVTLGVVSWLCWSMKKDLEQCSEEFLDPVEDDSE